jgi:hypothetical protein
MQHYSRVECAYRRSAGHQPPLCDTIPELSVPAGELLSLGRLERLERLDHEARPIFDAAVGVGCVHKSAPHKRINQIPCWLLQTKLVLRIA